MSIAPLPGYGVAKFFVIAIDDSVAGLFVLAGDAHVNIYLYRWWEIFLALVLVLVGTKPFKDGICCCFIAEFTTC